MKIVDSDADKSKEKANRDRKMVISLNVDSIGYNDALDKVMAAARVKSSGYVCFANVHMIVEAYKDRSFAEVVNGSMLVAADGMPIINMLRSHYNYKQQRIAGMDVMPELMRLSEKERLKVYFFGTTEDVLETIRIKAEKDFPALQIAGLLSPPFGKSLNDLSYVRQINDSGANIVFVALGCPKQEKWMAMHSDKIKAILLGVGGAFPIYAGVTRRAPRWVRDLSLEWAFRLGQEPTRLFKRYLKTNSLFLYLVFREKIRRVLHKVRG